jgi:hypothetical protein
LSIESGLFLLQNLKPRPHHPEKSGTLPV